MVEVTPASEWAQPFKEGVAITFPSKKKARLRPVGLELVINTCVIPESLVRYLVARIEKGMADLEPDLDATLDDEKAWFAFLDELTCLAFVEPEVVRKGEPLKEGQIRVEWIEPADKMMIWKALNLPARSLEPFFLAEIEYMEALANAKISAAASQQNIEDQKVDEEAVRLLGGSDPVHGGSGGELVRDMDRKQTGRKGSPVERTAELVGEPSG